MPYSRSVWGGLPICALIAGCELSGPRGNLKNRINTFLGNPLSAGVLMSSVQSSLNRAVCCLRVVNFFKSRFMESNTETMELCREKFGL